MEALALTALSPFSISYLRDLTAKQDWLCRPEVTQSIFLSSLSLPPCVLLSFISLHLTKRLLVWSIREGWQWPGRREAVDHVITPSLSLSRLRISDSVKSAFVAALNLQMAAKNTAWHIFLTIHVNDVLWIMVSFFTTVQYSASLLSF